MTTNYPTRLSDVIASVASSTSPLLDAQETTQHSNQLPSYRDFLVSGILKKIEHTERVYTAIDERDGKHRRQAYNACRTSAWFVRHKVSGDIRLASSRCNLRWCPLCIKTKKYVMLQTLIPWVKNAKKPKFITLTLKHSHADLNHQVDSLYKFFTKLRRRPYWKKRIKGGVWFFQLTKSSTDNCWHPHLHIICEGRYIPHSELSGIWCDITSGSSVVDIRAVKDVKKTADYVARYATAPAELSKLSLEDSIEVVDALAGRRICGTFGTGTEIQLVPKKCPDSHEWEYLAGYSEVLYKRKNSEWHGEIWRAFSSDDYCRSVPDALPPPNCDLIPLESEEPVTFKQLVFEWSNYA